MTTWSNKKIVSDIYFKVKTFSSSDIIQEYFWQCNNAEAYVHIYDKNLLLETKQNKSNAILNWLCFGQTLFHWTIKCLKNSTCYNYISIFTLYLIRV